MKETYSCKRLGAVGRCEKKAGTGGAESRSKPQYMS